MNYNLLLVYTIVAFFYIISPGPAVLLAIVNGLRGNIKIVVASSFGNMLGLLILSAASILGLGALIKTSALLFMIVKVTGALYLIYLGFKFLTNRGNLNFNSIQASPIKDAKVYFKEAFFVAVTNPKPILFFTAIFPQFLDLKYAVAPQFLTMTAIFLVISFSSLCAYGFLAKYAKKWLSSHNKMLWISRITGGIFISMGIGLLNLKQKVE